MGVTDARRQDETETAYPGVAYRVFYLQELDPALIQRMLLDLAGLFEAGYLTPLPLTVWDVRQARDAFRHMAQAKHTGKNILRLTPTETEGLAAGSVLVTGGTGTLGGLVARHLVAAHGSGAWSWPPGRARPPRVRRSCRLTWKPTAPTSRSWPVTWPTGNRPRPCWPGFRGR